METMDFTDRLLRGEKILWFGAPAQGLLFTGRDWLLVPFSLLWCGFTIFWESLVLAGPVFIRLWGAAFVLFGLYLVVGRFLLDTAQIALRRHQQARSNLSATTI